ncbi:MAG: hypothetical protein EZS28_009372 [Streblomastix strix]|uniref:Integrase catalytic domain-containing protein n=1 Tax=Streblomastix strix TaxID=222440 RepID=A0A5J4WL59_9EUKA|nr:MAG: hypothetical protein EZS28_009372 [Streblomastix strix]
MNTQTQGKEFVKNLNKQNLGKFDKKSLDKLYKQYILKHDQSNVPRLRNQPRQSVKKQELTQLSKPLNFPFKSKIEHFKKLHGKPPEKIQETPPDYQIKPLSKLNRPYFSQKLGSWEIDLVFSMDERIVRANQIYLFCININTKYLVVFPLRDKSAGQIKNALQILVKNNHVTNIRGDGEKGFSGNVLKTFCNENKITSFFTDSKFTNHSRVVDSVIRTIRNGFSNDSEKIAIRDTDVIASMHKEIDKFDEQAVKIKGLLEITDTKQAVQQKQEFTEE